jgi:hypothetical protein
MRIGIGVTSHNRHEVTRKTLEQIKRRLPAGATLAVVDDASTIEPLFFVNYRFDTNVGIARAKNKCLELLDGCDHIFLFDDDTFPIADDWWKPYVESPEAHLMYIFEDFADGKQLFDTARVYDDGQHIAYSHARGCMLYFKRRALDAVGGFDPAFGKWGHEHINLSDRINAAGLTTFPYMDVAGSNKLIHSGDEHRNVHTTVPGSERGKCLTRNLKLYDERGGMPYYVEYRAPEGGQHDAVLCCYFVGMVDPQRGEGWVANSSELTVLVESVDAVAPTACLAILNNASVAAVLGGVEVPTGKVSPYWQRWISLYQFLMANPNLRNVWCVDATDVEMLRNPFDSMEPGVLYVGDEQGTKLGIPWMFSNHPSRTLQLFFRQNANLPLLNCGVLGGSRDIVMEFIRKLLVAYAKNREDMKYKRDASVGEIDMGLFNWIAHTMRHRIVHGPKVTTKFKAFKDNGTAWWRHK